MYGYKRKLEVPYEEAVEKTRSSLMGAGFGIITEIDVKATLKKKLDIEYDNYIILGACNPQLAHKALSVEKDIGLMLPCNVIVYGQNNQVFVASIVPTIAMGMIKNPDLKEIAEVVETMLKNAIDRI